MDPLIAIVAHTDTTASGHEAVIIPISYAAAVESAGGIPFILPYTRRLDRLQEMARGAAGFIFPGGFDIDPALFGEAPLPELGRVDRDLDSFQIAVFRLALEMKVPVLGICKGAQLINVALGGSLYQDIASQFDTPVLTHMQAKLHTGTDHPVEISPNTRLHGLFGPRIWVNSRHHQAVKKPAPDMRITAKSSDGVIEGLEHQDLPIDLVQWHPELMLRQDPAMLPLFNAFVRRCA